MDNITGSNFTTEGDTRLNLPRTVQVSLIITIIINSIVCPFTVLLNAMVIRAVQKRPRLQTNANFLLASLATTDAFTGLASQPSYILWNTFKLLGMNSFGDALGTFHGCCLRAMTLCSLLHLMLVTCERLVAISLTKLYPYLVTKGNIKVVVIAFWVFSISYAATTPFRNKFAQASFLDLLATIILIFCVFFIASVYAILYRETRRHRKMIKTQQLPQEEVQRFARENKALKTTVLLVGAVVLCVLPIALVLLVLLFKELDSLGVKRNIRVIINSCAPCVWVNTSVMLNSFINPLIYCWRQKEMRQFVFRLSSFPVAPVQN